MSRDDWYRNIDWDEQTEIKFKDKLKRARDKSQYLRIQASYLIKKHPQNALHLLELYFDQGEHFDFAQAHSDRAKAYLAIEKVDEAIKSYNAAIQRESVYPQLLTNAYLDLPLLIAARGIQGQYDRALKILDDNQKRLTFPIDKYKWNAAKALIFLDSRSLKFAQKFASDALAASRVQKSGFRYHPKVGLFSDDKTDKAIYKSVKKIAETNP